MRLRWTTVALLALPALAGGAGSVGRATAAAVNVAYDGRFVFTRIRYDPPSGWGGGFRGGGGARWSHDYPNADLHLPQIIEYVTSIKPRLNGSDVITLEDPALFRSPIIYVSEPGYWGITEAGARNLRAFLLKGGFAIFDDFENAEIENMVAQLRRALPDARLIEIGPEHPIFSAFFDIKNIYFPHPLVAVTPRYYGVFEDNDPSRRMLAIVNHNNDLAEFWEWSDQGLFPVDDTSEAYRLGVNYIVWGLTH